jgi:hypothetical protein
MKPSQWVREQLRTLVSGDGPRLVPVDLDDVRVAPNVSPDHLMKRVGGPQALNEPPSVLARELDVPGDELALGLVGKGEVKLYPISVLTPAHIVNDRLDNTPVIVTFCRPCMSGLAFDPVLHGKKLSFDVFGTYRGVMAMVDRETHTVWAHMTGEALAGLLVGFRLAILPAQMGTWDRWLTLHPDALAPDVPIPTNRRGSYSFGPVAQERTRLTAGDQRLPEATTVLGVAVGPLARAYVLEDSDRRDPWVLDDQIGNIPIAVLSPPGLWPLAFDRRTPRGPVDLRLEGDRVIDQHGSRWSWDGNAMTGPLAGARLRFVHSTTVQWFAWAAYRPDTEVAGRTPAGLALARAAGQ